MKQISYQFLMPHSICMYLCISLTVHTQYIFTQEKNDNKSGFFRHWQEGILRLKQDGEKCIRCHVAKFRAGSDIIEYVASYTRHRKTGACRVHVGPYMQESDVKTCPD